LRSRPRSEVTARGDAAHAPPRTLQANAPRKLTGQISLGSSATSRLPSPRCRSRCQVDGKDADAVGRVRPVVSHHPERTRVIRRFDERGAKDIAYLVKKLDAVNHLEPFPTSRARNAESRRPVVADWRWAKALDPLWHADATCEPNEHRSGPIDVTRRTLRSEATGRQTQSRRFVVIGARRPLRWPDTHCNQTLHHEL
jgi:hypothetical protein